MIIYNPGSFFAGNISIIFNMHSTSETLTVHVCWYDILKTWKFVADGTRKSLAPQTCVMYSIWKDNSMQIPTLTWKNYVFIRDALIQFQDIQDIFFRCYSLLLIPAPMFFGGFFRWHIHNACLFAFFKIENLCKAKFV